MARDLGTQTKLIHGGTRRSPFGETSEALFLTSGFAYERAEDAEARFADRQEGFTYSRVGNPTVRMFEERMAALEGAEEATATASGMAAVNAALTCQLRAGCRVVASRAPVRLLRLHPDRDPAPLRRAGAACGRHRPRRLARRAGRAHGRRLLRDPGNPTLELVDIAAVCDLAHKAGARVVVDNVIATPILQQPLKLGADIVVYSATKHIDGQGRCLGGVILSDAKFKREKLVPFVKNTGPSLSPFNAWVLLKGLETLPLRLRAHVANAEAVARHLADHPGVEGVLYPGLPGHPQHELARRQMKAGGNLVAFRVGGGRERAFEVLNRLRLVLVSNNLGDAKSLITHPASTTHSRFSAERRAELGIAEDLLRLSVGIEDAADILADLDEALAA